MRPLGYYLLPGINCWLLFPYGTLAVSPRYTQEISPCLSITLLSTEKPPTPLSNNPILKFNATFPLLKKAKHLWQLPTPIASDEKAEVVEKSQCCQLQTLSQRELQAYLFFESQKSGFFEHLCQDFQERPKQPLFGLVMPI